MAGENRIRSSLVTLVGVAVVASLGIGLMWRSFEARRHGTEIPPNEIFEALVSRPIPTAVRDIQATGTTWQGFSIYLRFRSPSFQAAGISSPPYEKVDCSELRFYLELPIEIESNFSPEWTAQPTDSTNCLGAYELSNAWTKSGSHYVLKSGEWVYFVGFGS